MAQPIVLEDINEMYDLVMDNFQDMLVVTFEGINTHPVSKQTLRQIEKATEEFARRVLVPILEKETGVVFEPFVHTTFPQC